MSTYFTKQYEERGTQPDGKIDARFGSTVKRASFFNIVTPAGALVNDEFIIDDFVQESYVTGISLASAGAGTGRTARFVDEDDNLIHEFSVSVSGLNTEVLLKKNVVPGKIKVIIKGTAPWPTDFALEGYIEYIETPTIAE